MPIYEYVCQDCGEEVEVIQKISDPPLKQCQHCDGKLEKKLSLTSFQLKGGGWYAEGYSKKPAKADKTDSTDKPAAKKTTATKTKATATKAPAKKTAAKSTAAKAKTTTAKAADKKPAAKKPAAKKATKKE